MGRIVPITDRIKLTGTLNKLTTTLLHHVLKFGVILGLLIRIFGVNMLSRRSLQAKMPRITDRLYLEIVFLLGPIRKGNSFSVKIRIVGMPWVRPN